MGMVFEGEAHLCIAGLTFEITCRDLPIRQEFEKIYRPFLRPAGGLKESGWVAVRLLLARPPSVRKMETVFDTGESWSLHSDGALNWVAFPGPASGKPPRWVAAVDDERRRVDVYCGPEMTGREPDGRPVVLSPMHYPLDQILAARFLGGRGMIVHAAGAIGGGRGIVLAGVSGAGKSTITGLLAEGGRFELLSDDRVVVKRRNGRWRIFGTPWPGEAGVAADGEGDLSAILLLSKGAGSSLRRLGAREALERLVPVLSIPWYDGKAAETSLGLCHDLIGTIPLYDFPFRPDSTAAELLEKTAF